MGHGTHNVTHCYTHYEALHLCASKGQTDALREILPYLSERLGPPALRDILNAGNINGLGTVDLALKTNMVTARILREFGAVPQAQAPDNWKPGARRDPEYAKQQKDAQRVPVFVDNEVSLVRFGYIALELPSPSFWIQNLRMIAQRPSAAPRAPPPALQLPPVHLYTFIHIIYVYAFI